MSSPGSVTHWLGQLKAGNLEAVQELWERYFQQLVHLARKKLRGAPRKAADEEDVALSVFDSFCRDAQRGQFPQLADRDNLWRLLVVLTGRKASDLVRHEKAVKRGGGRTADADDEILVALLSREPTPEFAARVADEFRHLLTLLPDDEARTLATLKMEGYSTEEIAQRLGCVPRTVRRRLELIRTAWDQEVSA